jgi:hypothetical protein
MLVVHNMSAPPRTEVRAEAFPGPQGLRGVSLEVPMQELPPDEYFSIRTVMRDLELLRRDWAADLLAGYFCQASAPWER